MAYWESITVREAVSRMHDERMVLPAIQRNLVWDEYKMELLFDSLFCRNSFGSIICVEEDKDTEPLFAHRIFREDSTIAEPHKDDKLKQSTLLIIDGQQRLQSFYTGLCGTYGGKILYFDLFSNPTKTDYNYNFKFAPSERVLFKRNRENLSFGEHLWCSVPYIFSRLKELEDSDVLADEIIDEKGITERDRAKCIEKNISDFYKRIFADQTIGLSKVIAHMSKDIKDDCLRIAEMFQRLNTSGTKLSHYDLFISGMSVFNYRIRSFLKELADEDSLVDMEFLIKMILVLNDHPSKNITDISSIEGAKEDAEFATNNMERIRATLEALKKFLKASNHDEWFDSGSNRSAIPLYFIAYHIFWQSDNPDEIRTLFERFDTNDKNFRNMSRWLKVSLLNNVFKRGCGWEPSTTAMKKIHEIMSKNKGRDFPVSELFDLYRKRLHRFFDHRDITYQCIDSLDKEYVFFMIYGSKKSAIRSEDEDHINPKALLEKANVSLMKINSIGNLQYIDRRTNRGEKSSLELRDWINSKVENKDEYLSRHLIPEDESLWTSGKFTPFLNARLRLIARKIKSML